MAEPFRFPGDVQCQNISWTGTHPPIARSGFAQENLQRFALPIDQWRIWDAIGLLTDTPGTDDLGLIIGTWGASVPYLSEGDQKANGAVVTRYARQRVILPPSYVAGETIQLVAAAGMITTIADVSATVDFEVYKVGRDTLVSGADICATAAQSINALGFADKTFTITPTTLNPGDTLEVRVALACRDNATATAVTPAIAMTDLLLDIKG